MPMQFWLDGHVQDQPDVMTISPSAGAIGVVVTLSGDNFGEFQGGSTVTFAGIEATDVIEWSDGLIRVRVPPGAQTGEVVVTVIGEPSDGELFTVLAPGASIAGRSALNLISGLSM